MKKQRMTADNVEQLMEIVRALQQGEEPDPKKRKKAAAEEGTDAFEQSLQDDRTEADFAKGKEAVSSAVSKAAGFLGGIKEKQKQRRDEQAKKRAEEKEREKQRRAEEAGRESQRRTEEKEREKQQRTEEKEREEQRRTEEAGRESQRRVEETGRESQRRAEEAGRESQRRAEEAGRESQRRVEETEREEQRRAEETERESQSREKTPTGSQDDWDDDFDTELSFDNGLRQLGRVSIRATESSGQDTLSYMTKDSGRDVSIRATESSGQDTSSHAAEDFSQSTASSETEAIARDAASQAKRMSLSSLFHSKEKKEKKYPQKSAQDDMVFELDPAELPVAEGVELDPDELAVSGLSKSEQHEYEKRHQQSAAHERSKKHQPTAEERRRLNHLERSLLEQDDDEPKKEASHSESSTKAGRQIASTTDTLVEASRRSASTADTPVEAGRRSDSDADTLVEASRQIASTADTSAGLSRSSAPDSVEKAAAKPESQKHSKSKTPSKVRTGKPKKQDRKLDSSLPEMLSEIAVGTKSGVQDLLEELGQKGIRSRELVMLGAVALFVVLLVLIAVNTVRNTVEQNQKSRNVTADEGLVITVEDEPSSWCTSYPVKLKVYVKRETVTSVSINGTAYTPDEEGMITVNADNWVLDAEVKTESATRSARIELEYLDGDAPVLEVKKEGSQITLVAVDARSGVEGIYYAAVSEDDYIQMPYYQRYTESLTYEEDTVYRFYAKDKAGNCSTPVVSTMDTAQSFSLNQNEVSLFPGETFGLSVTAEPEGALLENIRYESMDESVATVEQNGKVTAVGNGTAAIRVTADTLESQICTVTVSNERTVTISAIGDCTLGTDENFNTSTNFDAFDAVNGHSYFFQNVSSILSQDDITFANFEGTLTDSTERASKEYAFKGDASYTDILNLGSVEVVTLANNHSSDYGEESLLDTEQALTDAGIDYCNGDDIVIRDVNGVRTAFIGIYVLDVGIERESQVKETIARAQKQGAQLIIVAFHWGTEASNYPDETQTSLAHTAIDCGADLVVGHHPHVLQGIEKYNGKYIVYSLGNFCFGGNSSPSDMDTIIFRQTFTISASGVSDTDDIQIIPCKISSASGYNNFQPTLAAGTDAEEIISRLNEYSAAYGQTYTAADVG